MNQKDRVSNLYFEWLCNLVTSDICVSYKKLLTLLHLTRFTYILDMDSNRAADGVTLRYRFSLAYPDIYDAEELLAGDCSILEMMVGLALRCEETIMDNPEYGDRTGQWFFTMIKNLGLNSMSDELFDKDRCIDILNRFLNRDFDADGKGGLFRVRNSEYDFRKLEIWVQLCLYLDTLAG